MEITIGTLKTEGPRYAYVHGRTISQTVMHKHLEKRSVGTLRIQAEMIKPEHVKIPKIC